MLSSEAATEREEWTHFPTLGRAGKSLVFTGFASSVDKSTQTDLVGHNAPWNAMYTAGLFKVVHIST